MDAKSILHPFYFQKKQQVLENKLRFVHYTRASVAISIIKTNRIWMRNSSCMNDFMEIIHGYDCLVAAYKSEAGQDFKKLINSMYPSLMNKVEKYFQGYEYIIKNDTFLTCLSEHDAREDNIGRLSMWRAYGHDTGVAIVINTHPFFGDTNKLGAYSSPVNYQSASEVEHDLEVTSRNIEMYKHEVSHLDEEEMFNLIFNAFLLKVFCTKHAGFAEEREWRIIYSKVFGESDALESSLEVINGVPQTIYKIPLTNDPAIGLHQADIPSLIDRIIIGPTLFPGAVKEAFCSLLEKIGIHNAHERVIVSDIPIRL